MCPAFADPAYHALCHQQTANALLDGLIY
jgi:hypothetical protein